MSRVIALLLLTLSAQAASLPWNLKDLEKTPQSWGVASAEPDVKAVFIAGPPYKGKPTRAFAYYAVPRGASKAPAMVLIHGGGGTAFAEWVRLWNREGFAAIAIDTVGTIPDRAGDRPWNPARKRHEFAGPATWGDFQNIDAPLTDQWTYHAVAVSILAHSFLRTQPGVDAKRTGVTGISWGGYLTSIVASLDQRFRFGIPVYGCGFLSEDSAWLKDFGKLGPARSAQWVRLWDPSSYLGQGRRPMFWINGTNDFAYVMPSWQKSYRLPRGERLLSLQVRLPHGHPEGARIPEVLAYARARFASGAPLINIEKQGASDTGVWATYNRSTVKTAELCYTSDSGKWQDRRWSTAPAYIDSSTRRVTAAIPPDARVYYLNLVDDRGLTVSTEHRERDLPETAIHRENIEWCDAWMPNMNDHGLPRVLLIGDSITRGYYQAVEQLLKGKAYVARITTSKAIGDPALLTELSTFLAQVPFNVVHFNIGMHGWAYSEQDYQQHFSSLVSTIRKHAPNARLIWASTTPVRTDRKPGPANDRIRARNAIAAAFAGAHGIAVDDLHALMTPHGDMHSDDVHFNKEAGALMAEQVAREVSKLLPR